MQRLQDQTAWRLGSDYSICGVTFRTRHRATLGTRWPHSFLLGARRLCAPPHLLEELPNGAETTRHDPFATRVDVKRGVTGGELASDGDGGSSSSNSSSGEVGDRDCP